MQETVATFEGLIELKLTKAWGVSNFGGQQLGEALAAGRPAEVQNSYSLLDRGDEGGLVQLCAELGIAYTPFSPLAGGWLTGKYKRDEAAPEGSRMAMRPGPYEHLRTPETFTALDRFAKIAQRRGVDSATLAISWLLAQPWVTAVVVGPRRPAHLEPALRALEQPLSKAEADDVGALFAG
jgi:aryl-alcohol dehydrogenase-like predicted oxidoreductase